MDSTTERRAPGATRIPFDALVEVGDAGGQPFEAQALDLSHHGMHLRTAYLPELGQPLSCRFEAGTASVICEGEVAWCQDEEPGGEFGLRFTNLDAESAAGLKQILNGAHNSGCKVRLHIEGLASPMRGRIKESHGAKVTATSELGFLQLGKGLELEDATNGAKRACHIDRVEVEIDPNTQVPQLVVAMRYDDVEDTSSAMKDSAPETKASSEENRENDSEPTAAKKATTAILAKSALVGPAMMAWMSKASGTATTWWKNRSAGKSDAKTPARRTTAAAPQSSLSGGGAPARKMRSQSSHASTANAAEMEDVNAEATPLAFATKHKRRIAIGAVAITAGILGYAALHKITPTTATAEATTTAVALEPSPSPMVSAQTLPARPAGMNAPIAMQQPIQGLPALGNPSQAAPIAAMNPGAEEPAPITPVGKPMPFGHGNVTGGKVLKFKMDGNIGRIQGASQPTGFTVVIPQRKSLTSGPAAMKQDKRIAQMKVANDPGGAEVNVTFKDGVPPYLVRANKDVLEVVLGAPSAEDKKNGGTAEAPSKKHGSKKASHGKKHH